MKKFGINKQYPNPPWPSDQPVVVIPPGSNPTSVGVPNMPLRTIPAQEQGFENMQELQNEARPSSSATANYSMVQGEERQFPLMGNMTNQMTGQGSFPQFSLTQTTQGCSLNSNVTDYLCSQIGRYVRIEFMFGSNMHVEKTGIMREVGRNYIVISETGTNNMTVCSTNNVKFINIYNMNEQMPRN